MSLVFILCFQIVKDDVATAWGDDIIGASSDNLDVNPNVEIQKDGIFDVVKPSDDLNEVNCFTFIQ